ncbi:39S ribosomal protein L48, mitochondrial [Microplitis mediator]|uniref:39S ribosomal protein L48, mitochondrial n=1 Tax=Microplitis mediator TaxID=375433 RepID=UPI0025562FC2|nr:39S ribosomal protein L48, mitochondrial [Microplitis mediator]
MTTRIMRKNDLLKPLYIASMRCFPKFCSLYTPNYLEAMKPKIPLYPTVSIQIKGYNYPALENYQRLIHKYAENVDVDVENSYALPSKSLKIQRFKHLNPSSKIEYKLEIYQRNILISNLSSIKFPILLRLLESTLPEGVELKVEQWNPEIEELRFVPDKQLIDLKTELESMRKK